MNILVCLLLSGLAVILCVAQSSGPESEFYTAAVVEYGPGDPGKWKKPPMFLQENSFVYMSYISEAAKRGADIIVFPECGLTGINLPTSREELRPYLTEIPEPSQNPNPCWDTRRNTTEILKDLSCGSLINEIYVVVNLPEIAPCDAQDGTNTSCPDDGAFIYNTNIVFDRAGVIIAKYRKYNLFNEPGFDIEPTAAHSTFDTDFGVRFGMFICFDILFHQPAVALVTEQNITDIVYSTAWFSELPFLTAVQTQAAWSYATDTNLLASGYNYPANMNTGSGIFAGRDGVVTSVMAFTQISQMLVAKVKKKTPMTGEMDTDSNGTRTTREDNEGDREGAFVNNEESEGSDEYPMLNEELSGYSSAGSQTRQDEKGFKRNDDAIQHTREDENNTGGSEMRKSVPQEVDEPPTRGVPTARRRRSYFEPHEYFNTSRLELSNEGGHNESLSLCHWSLCCTFKLHTGAVRESSDISAQGEFYRAAVYDGEGRESSYKTCVVVKCTGSSLDPCIEDSGRPETQGASTIFTGIDIFNGIFKKRGKMNLYRDHNVYFSGNVGSNTQRVIMSYHRAVPFLSIFILYTNGFPNERYRNLLASTDLNLYQEDLSRYNTLLIGSQHIHKQLNLCHGSLCCEFYIGVDETKMNSTDEGVSVKNSPITSQKGHYFRIGVFEGVRKFMPKVEAGLQVCAVFACTTENITTCGLFSNKAMIHGVGDDVDVPQTSQAATGPLDVGVGQRKSLDQGLVLKRVEIKGYFEKDNLIMPNTVTTMLLPFIDLDFEFSSESKQNMSDVDGNKTFATMKTNAAVVGDMLTFGIYARDFRKDVA